MRWALNRLALAITSMVALAFLVPLAVATRQIAYDRAISDARQQATSMVTVLGVDSDLVSLTNAVASTAAGSAGNLAVHLPGIEPIGASHLSDTTVQRAAQERRAATADSAGGVAYLQPTVLTDGRTVVVEVFIPEADTRRGVGTAWLYLGALAVVLVGGSILFADRLGSQLVRATRGLAAASRRLGGGELNERITPIGPSELRDAATAFNGMADDLRRLLDRERELAADLSHRLRTPLTGLRLDVEAMPPGPIAERMRQACDLLDEELEAIITGARLGSIEKRGSQQCDLVEVLADRLAFWSVLAEDQERPWEVVGGNEPVMIPMPAGDVILVVDALLGNVFSHTPDGTAFRVSVSASGLLVDDAGPGIPDPETAVQRGVSGAGSTGLGLDIVRRTAETVRGQLVIDRSPLGGARIGFLLHAPVLEPADQRRRR
ncbi:signal transduction histidine kinase [Actinoplanes campanulatus]|uniref:histidine kinase n=1 Tax=Actinoplanes campanulatus TaxID=113559 RepID=A0A7W5FH57_9ACTN|nr:ATP-binding protein [Actinoplanes campanulatus]MBB3098259.1 signal transduction histidine kinase [Actinoplanes campanulatus]GGN34701.1 two-component sensor histidine kinase [Actinoplanes campanulatus]GID38782.1 two-component sensor histidine kinase [Actinoplanes campanulatus]